MELSDLNSYGEEILKLFVKEGVAPLPSNYYSYFNENLKSKDEDFRKYTYKLIEITTSGSSEFLEVEQKIAQNINYLKHILFHIHETYKVLASSEQHGLKVLESVDTIEEIVQIEKIMSELLNAANMVGDETKNSILGLQEQYSKVVDVVKDVFEESIYDPKYQIFNKKFLLKKLSKEIEQIGYFRHESIVMMIKANRTIIKPLNEENALTLNKAISKLLMKATRRSDFIFHYEAGIFVIMLKNMNLAGAKATSGRIRDISQNTSFFVGEKQITIDLSIGIISVDPKRDAVSNLMLAMDAVKKADNDKSLAHVILNSKGEVTV